MESAEATGFLSNYHKEERPWGGFEQFTLNEQSTVKIITVKAGEEFSLQTHEHRDEFWHVLKGNGTITLDEQTFEATPGKSYLSKRATKHRAKGGTEDLVFLEIAFGEFSEGDIKRLEDKYGRS